MEKRKTEVDLISEKPEQTGLLKYMLEKGITQFHVVKHVEEYLKEHGFSELKLKDKWQLQAGADFESLAQTATIQFCYDRISSAEAAAAYPDSNQSYGFSNAEVKAVSRYGKRWLSYVEYRDVWRTVNEDMV